MHKSRKEILLFLLIGTTTVVIDFLSYRLCMALMIETGTAKATGFLVGTIFAFFANRQWTFAASSSHAIHWEIAKFALVYGLSLLVNVSTNSGLLALAGRSELAIAFSFVVATGVSATMNFFGMKFLVFRPAGSAPPGSAR